MVVDHASGCRVEGDWRIWVEEDLEATKTAGSVPFVLGVSYYVAGYIGSQLDRPIPFHAGDKGENKEKICYCPLGFRGPLQRNGGSRALLDDVPYTEKQFAAGEVSSMMLVKMKEIVKAYLGLDNNKGLLVRKHAILVLELRSTLI
ncbi:hypothetical protein SUGI_0998850 [Cryptomeria japonica]|nr:hypothetical protein SUGI_0998850 [Cryptomeria japonica]